jgi:Opioid growth factor receptor (OGFr) conserved region
MTASPLIAFYDGNGTDHRGRTLSDILRWDEAHLEQVHDYIQWLFPLPARSAYNPHAPLLTEADVAAFIERDELRERVEDVLDRILDFYGLERDDEERGPVIRKARDFPQRSRHWLTPQNHNYLRISRILQFLMLIGMEPLARAFWRALAELCRYHRAAIGDQTVRHWMRAAEV